MNHWAMSEQLKPIKSLAGPMVATPAALDTVGGWLNALILFGRFFRGDFGLTEGEDLESNHAAIRHADGRMILASYDSNGDTVWIIAAGYGLAEPGNPDAAYVTLLLPEEY
jgi:hypothetical protein